MIWFRDEHDADFSNDVLEDEKDSSSFDIDISQELNAEANSMLELEAASPETEDEEMDLDSPSIFEDSTPFEEEVKYEQTSIVEI